MSEKVEEQEMLSNEGTSIAPIDDSGNSMAIQNVPETPAVLASTAEKAIFDEIKFRLERLADVANGIANSSAKTADDIHGLHKLYHNEFSGRLQSMQKELDGYREIEKGRIYDEILRDIAKIYSDYISIVDNVSDEKQKKHINYMFDDILQVLESYGVSKLQSKLGEKRNTRHCSVREKLSTDNQELHDTVASSRNIGFYLENRTLVKEMVDVYVYSKKLDSTPSAIDESKVSKEECENG
jgi:molecular chaperone GrpE (heat shock protein)